MTDALDLLARMRRAGFTLRRSGGLLLVSPAAQLTAGQRETVRRHKAALLDALSAEADDLTEAALRQGWDPWRWPAGQPCLLVEIFGRVEPWRPEEWERLKAASLALCRPPQKRRKKKAKRR